MTLPARQVAVVNTVERREEREYDGSGNAVEQRRLAQVTLLHRETLTYDALERPLSKTERLSMSTHFEGLLGTHFEGASLSTAGVKVPFEDWSEPERRRHLLRLWLCPPDGRPLPPIFAERYGSIEVGRRGGVHVPDSELKAPLEVY